MGFTYKKTLIIKLVSFKALFTNPSLPVLTREWGISVQLASTLLQETETEREGGRVVQQVEHQAVSRGLMGRHVLPL